MHLTMNHTDTWGKKNHSSTSLINKSRRQAISKNLAKVIVLIKMLDPIGIYKMIHPELE